MTDQNKQSNRAVVYCRVSTKEQADEGDSLKWQEKYCREYAEKNAFEMIRVFVEAGESAKTANRTELREMLAFCAQKKNRIDTVIVHKLDRLSRNTDDYSQLRLLLRRYGVVIRSVTEKIEDTPVGRFMENTIANVAQFDNDIRSERCSDGMKEAMRMGRYVWGAPVGLINTEVLGKPDVLPNDMSKLVKRAFELVASGLYPTDEAWRIMIKEGLKTKKGKPISKPYFHEMLRNILYVGWIAKFGEKHRARYGQIVSDELFAEVQRVLKNKGHKVGQYKTDNPDFPLRRFVFNPLGTKVTGSWSTGNGGRYPKYRFGAKGSNYDRDKFEEGFTKLMDSYQFSDADMDKLKLLVRKHFHRATQNEARTANKMELQLQELENNESAMIQKNIKGIISDELLKKELEKIEKLRIDIRVELAMSRNEQSSPEEAVAFAEEYLRQPSMVWRKSDISIQTKLQWFQFPSGVTFDGQIFGTKEVVSVFKAKDTILAPKFADVDCTGIAPVTSRMRIECSAN